MKGQPHRAVLVFSAATVKELVSDNVRLPPTYVGVRRVRPSNRIRDELRSQTNSGPCEVVYKITDSNGAERRMNTQEKKGLKLRLKKAKQEAKKKQMCGRRCNRQGREFIKESTRMKCGDC